MTISEKQRDPPLKKRRASVMRLFTPNEPKLHTAQNTHILYTSPESVGRKTTDDFMSLHVYDVICNP